MVNTVVIESMACSCFAAGTPDACADGERLEGAGADGMAAALCPSTRLQSGARQKGLSPEVDLVAEIVLALGS
jgi:hypothetical protein